jgi:hypothetical protein
MNEKIEILCSILQVSANEVNTLGSEWFLIGGCTYYVGTETISHLDYNFFAQVGPYLVYRSARPTVEYREKQ